MGSDEWTRYSDERFTFATHCLITLFRIMSSSMCTVCGPHIPLVRSDESVSILLALFSVFLLLLLSTHNIDLYRFRTSLFRLITKIIAEYFMRRLKFGRWMFENVTKQEVRWNHRTQLHLSEIYSFAILYNTHTIDNLPSSEHVASILPQRNVSHFLFDAIGLSVVSFICKREASYTIPFSINNFKVQRQQCHFTSNVFMSHSVATSSFAAVAATYCHSSFELRSIRIHPFFFPLFSAIN